MIAPMPLVSVMIPNYNYGRYLGQAIDSVLAQSYPNVEVLVVDDGSTDHSAAVARGYGDRVRWIQQARQGVAAARNRGVQESRGELVAFLDADDFWFAQKVERQVTLWRSNPALGLVHCGAQLVDASGRTLEVQQDGMDGWIAHEMLLFKRRTIVCTGSSALIPRSIFTAVGGFDIRLSTSADWDLCYRISVRHPVGFVRDVLIAVRMHQTNMHADIRVMEHDMLRAYAKAFQDAEPSLRRLQRRSYGNLHMVLGGSFAQAGRRVAATRHILTSLWLAPENVVRLMAFPLRWWRRRAAMAVHRRSMRRAGQQILYLSYDGALEPLGQSQITPYLKGLALRGATITLLSFEKPGDGKDRGRVQALRADLASVGIRWIPLTYHRHPAVLATAFDVLVGTARAWRVVRRDRIDIVHARSYVAALMAWILAHLSQVLVVFDMRGFWADERVEGGLWAAGGLLYRLTKRFERIFLREADAIVTLTERAKQTIQDWLGGAAPPISVIPTCVDVERFSLPSASGPLFPGPVFIYIGSVGTWHSLPEILRFMRCAVGRFPGARLLLLTRQTTEAAACVRAAQLPSGTVTVASVNASEVPRWLARAHAGLAFYTPGFSRQGTCPTKLGEYLAMGLPVVVNAGVGDVEALVDKTGVGVILPALSPEAYDQALDQLERLWGNPQLAHQCRAVAQASFSLQSGIEQYWQVYQRLSPAQADAMITSEPWPGETLSVMRSMSRSAWE